MNNSERNLDAIHSLVPDAQFSWEGTLYEGLMWLDGNTQSKPSETAIENKAKELRAAEPMQLLRKNRNALLASSDWTGLADTALTSEVSAKWKLYRQKLRDLPKGLTTEAKVKAATWPTKP